MPGPGVTAALTARRIFDGERWLRDHVIVVDGQRISSVMQRKQLPADTPVTDLGDTTIAPGLIDVQVNGGGGVLLNNQPDRSGLRSIARAHRCAGTTAIMPTVISDTAALVRTAAEAAAAAIVDEEAGIIGLHIEGPFFAPARRGTHKADMIRRPDAGDLEWLCQPRPFPLMLTLAPEQLPAGVVRMLSDAGVLVCAGHTDADYERVRQAIDEGLRGFTHLFNAMSPLTSREPGAVGAALEDAATWAGIIADGHHVHPATLALAQRCKARGKLFLVSDAMATVGSAQDSFELYGERITVRDGCLVNAEGRLAGSAISLLDAVRIAHREAGIELGECLRMASLYPATFLKLEHERGRLQEGYRADLVAFDEHFAATDTWVGGEHLAHPGQP